MSEVAQKTDLPALHDALDSARSAAWAAESGDQDGASLALMEASAAAKNPTSVVSVLVVGAPPVRSQRNSSL